MVDWEWAAFFAVMAAYGLRNVAGLKPPFDLLEFNGTVTCFEEQGFPTAASARLRLYAGFSHQVSSGLYRCQYGRQSCIGEIHAAKFMSSAPVPNEFWRNFSDIPIVCTLLRPIFAL